MVTGTRVSSLCFTAVVSLVPAAYRRKSRGQPWDPASREVSEPPPLVLRPEIPSSKLGFSGAPRALWEPATTQAGQVATSLLQLGREPEADPALPRTQPDGPHRALSRWASASPSPLLSLPSLACSWRRKG